MLRLAEKGIPWTNLRRLVRLFAGQHDAQDRIHDRRHDRAGKNPPEGVQLAGVNDEIPDERISAQIDLIERLTAQIFDCVRKNPKKLSQIRQFLNYYLPTTIKLMEQYVTLQNQSLKTENITEGMQKIEDLLDKVIIAFQRQLDALFEADVVDITADIRVMEQMMASEGLTNKKDFA